MNSIPVITTTNTETSNNNISLNSYDLREGDLCIPFPMVSMIYGYMSCILELPDTIRSILTDFGRGETIIKRVLIVLSLMDKHPESWVTKDAELQTLVVHLLLVLYKSEQTHIEKIMFGICDRFMDEASTGEITEKYYKDGVDITMRLRTFLKELDKFNILIEPKGSWVMSNGKKLLKLSYY